MANAPRDELLFDLQSRERANRIAAAHRVGAHISSGEWVRRQTKQVNNHVHTQYSFSPYTPAMAAYLAWSTGLSTVGIMDHDSVAGCDEMIETGTAMGIAQTVGCEIRVDMSHTAMEGRRINNPDISNNAYIAIHAIPQNRLPEVADFLHPVQEARNRRNRKIVDNLNDFIAGWDLGKISFETDVYPLSLAKEHGTITERHILSALATRVLEASEKNLVPFVEGKMGLAIPPRMRKYLSDRQNPHITYDLLGVFKSGLIPHIYVAPTENECVPVRTAVQFAQSVHAIPAYAYMGDVSDSPTGDKKAAKFEDDFLDDLVAELPHLGFLAVTYMPPRNTLSQLKRLQSLCQKQELMEISGVDINSSRQTFNCPEVLQPDFLHLVDAAWALTVHEKLAAADPRLGLFHSENPRRDETLSERIRAYALIGRQMDIRNPNSALEIAEKKA